ncbi:MAG: alanine--tRNA ligase, partial [Bacillota bacterium]|nr:alanine--tRNA ligase [Bacillota bacterium]
IPSGSLIPENDPTVLFTTAGMHPLVPYLLGEKHPAGKRLANVQKCVRTGDIEEVGDPSHCTFFEMLGNWSLGDYFKKEAIEWSFEFLTSEKWLNIPQKKLYFTCFEGDEDAPRDIESYNIWRHLGVEESHIFFLPKRHNWWGPAGIAGPCGPDTEMFIDTGSPACSASCSPVCSCGKYFEIWNDVFMEYNKTADGRYEPLSQKNVDTGMGLERTAAILQGKATVYETDLFSGTVATIEKLSGKRHGDDPETTRAIRIIADHMRCATFIMGDEHGITPSNVDQGYVLRRLIRRSIRFSHAIGMPEGSLGEVSAAVVARYSSIYPELKKNEPFIQNELLREQERFERVLISGLREFEKAAGKVQGRLIDGATAFRLYDTFGFPVEFTVELARERGLNVDTAGFEERFRQHQEVSRQGSEQRFAGGLADASEQTARLHTATHLLLAALRNLVSEDIRQRGSNITVERLRFDFNFERKLTEDEIKSVENLVNEWIKADAPVVCEEMSIEDARTKGAMGIFDAKYGDVVKVYTMGSFSCEICGGPHASRTGELGKFRIQKEESSSAGVRRIRAVLE